MISSTTGGAESKDPQYMKRLSASLRKQMFGPVTKIPNPTFEQEVRMGACITVVIGIVVLKDDTLRNVLHPHNILRVNRHFRQQSETTNAAAQNDD